MKYAPEKMLQFHVEGIVVACCIVELGQLKREKKQKKSWVLISTGFLFGKCSVTIKTTIHHKYTE